MSLRSHVSWALRGPARLEQLERSIDELRHEIRMLATAQDDALADVRATVSATLDDIDQRVAALDPRSK